MSELQSLGTFMGSAFQRIDANLEALTAILQNGVQCHCNCGGSSESNSGSIAGVDASRAGILEAEIVDGNLMVSWPKGVEFDTINAWGLTFSSGSFSTAGALIYTSKSDLENGYLTETEDKWICRTKTITTFTSNNCECIVLMCIRYNVAVASFFLPIKALNYLSEE